jgi:phage shock protein C
MAQQDQPHTTTRSADSFPEFSDAQLHSTLDAFLEKQEDADQPNIWNTATIAGIAMFLVCMVYILHLIGLDIIPGFGAAFIPLAVVGALLVGFTGFGFFVGDRRRVKHIRKKQKKKREDYFEAAFPPKDDEENIDLEEELFGNSVRASGESKSGRKPFDDYALKQPKKLYKSRTNKKISGVCGGLADYFGISATWIRIFFLAAFFGGYGISMVLYIVLMIVLDKEPAKPLREFDIDDV